MKTLMTLRRGGLLAIGGLSLLALPAAGAQDRGPGHHCCPMAGQPAAGPTDERPGTPPVYDPDTVTTVRGTASAVTVVPAHGGRRGGMHVTLASDGQAMEVHLGPTWFLRREGVAVSKGDAVEVTGSVVESEGQRFLVAREVKLGSRVVTLRDEQGIPVWSGRRR